MNVSSQVVCNSSLSYAVGPKNGVATNVFLFINVCSSVCAIVGNTMVLFAVCKNENLQRVSNYFICSLAVADLIVGMIHIPLYSSLMALRVDSKGAILKIDFLLWLQILFATTLNLCAVSIDRYIAVKMPLKYTVYMTDKNCARIIGMVWSCSILFAIPGVFIDDLSTWSGYALSCSLVTLLIPLSIIVACYLEILKISRQQLKKIGCAESMNVNAEQRRMNSKNRKALTTFAIVTVVFTIAFTPNFVMAVWYEHAKDDCEKKRYVFRLWTMSLFVMHLSSSANPVIYGRRNKDFKTAFKRMYSCIYGICHGVFVLHDHSKGYESEHAYRQQQQKQQQLQQLQLSTTAAAGTSAIQQQQNREEQQ